MSGKERDRLKVMAALTGGLRGEKVIVEERMDGSVRLRFRGPYLRFHEVPTAGAGVPGSPAASPRRGRRRARRRRRGARPALVEPPPAPLPP